MNSFKMEIKVGLFVFAVIVASLAILVYVGIKKDLFADKVRYKIRSTTGDRIERGIPVKLSGFKIGQVTNLTLEKDVMIEIEILKKYQGWFKTDSLVMLDQEGFIGNAYLKLIPGSESARVLPENSIINMHKVGGIEQLVEQAKPVIDDMKRIVENLRRLTDFLLDENGQMRRIIARVDLMTEQMNSTDGLVYYLTQNKEPVRKLDSFLNHSDQLMVEANNLTKNATMSVQNMVRIQNELAGVLQEGRELVDDLQPSVDNANAITGEVRNATQNLRSLRAESEYALRLSNELMERLRQTWPFARKEDEPKRNFPVP